MTAVTAVGTTLPSAAGDHTVTVASGGGARDAGPPSIVFRSLLWPAAAIRDPGAAVMPHGSTGAGAAPAHGGPRWAKAAESARRETAAEDEGEEERRLRDKLRLPSGDGAPSATPMDIAPPAALPSREPVPEATPMARAAISLEDLLPALVRRVSWSGDRQRGTVRLEIGAGELEGATLLVHSVGGQVSVLLDVPPGVDAGQWQERLRERLGASGVAAADVVVT